jgi:predicted TIM-barrel fold metal-dependent hydrolase
MMPRPGWSNSLPFGRRFVGGARPAEQGRRDHPNLPEAPSVTARKFYYDTVCYGSKAAFTCALEAFGADHLVTGSDYPVLQDYESYTETFAYIERLGLPKSDTDKILHHNAQQLFGFR